MAWLAGVGYYWIAVPRSQAQTALGKHHLLVAQEHIVVALRRGPRSPQTLLLAARISRRLGALDDAETHLKDCEHDSATDADSWTLERKLLDLQRGGVAADAEPKLRAWAEQQPQNRTLIYEALAEGCAKELRIPATLAFLNDALREASENVVVLRRRGRLHVQLGNLQEAVADFRRAAELEPAHQQGQLLFADALVKTGRFAEALPWLQRHYEQRPNDVIVLVGLAVCHTAVGEFDHAKGFLIQAYDQEPRNAVVSLERGRLELERNRPDLAESWLRESLAADPADRRANHLLFQCLRLQDKDDDADKQLAKTQRVIADLTRLREIITDELDKRPGDVGLHHELGVLYLRNGQAKQGVDWLERALKLDARHRLTHQALAEYYDRTGQPDRAAVHRGRVN